MKDNTAFNTNTPPSQHARSKLVTIMHCCGIPAQEMNFTVRDKLLAWGYIRLVSRKSPYKSHPPGRKVDFALITEAGVEYLNQHM